MEQIIKDMLSNPQMLGYIITITSISFVAGASLVMSIYCLLNDKETTAFIMLILFIMMVFVGLKESYLI